MFCHKMQKNKLSCSRGASACAARFLFRFFVIAFLTLLPERTRILSLNPKQISEVIWINLHPFSLTLKPH